MYSRTANGSWPGFARRSKDAAPGNKQPDSACDDPRLAAGGGFIGGLVSIGSRGTRPQAAEARATAFADGLEGDVEHRDHEEPDSARGDHAGEDRGADIV